MATVIYPGTFDPITNGHLDIIERSAKLFDRTLIAVANSPSKKPMFSLDERVELVRESCQYLPNVDVFGFQDLLANVVKKHQIQAIIRGIRNTVDFEYELQLASLNRHLADDVESLFFPTRPQYSHISSTVVREIFLHKGDVQHLVPPAVYRALVQKSI